MGDILDSECEMLVAFNVSSFLFLSPLYSIVVIILMLINILKRDIVKEVERGKETNPIGLFYFGIIKNSTPYRY
jgi:hypothetical protein